MARAHSSGRFTHKLIHTKLRTAGFPLLAKTYYQSPNTELSFGE